jgi:RNA polymerase-binding transcription factor DksA
MTKQYNSNGVELGPRGYVICRVCGEEVPDISRETTKRYAECVSHQRDSKRKERGQ